MKIRLVKVLIICTLISECISARVYKLDEIISTALISSRSVKLIEKEMQKSDSYIQEIFGGALPKISTSVNYSHEFKTYSRSLVNSDNFASDSFENDSLDTNDIVRSIGTMLSSLNERPGNTASISLSIEQPVFLQGKVSMGVRIAKIHRSTLNCKFQEEKHKVKGAIIKLFYASLNAQNNLQVAKDLIKFTEEMHRLAVVKYTIGKTSELDTLTSSMHLKKAQMEFRKAESDLRIVYETLMTNAGIYEPVTSFGVIGDYPPAEYNETLDSTIEHMKRGNFALNQLKGAQEIEKLKIKLAQTAFLPDICAGLSLGKIAEFNKISDFGNQKWGDEQKIYVGAKWDIYTGSVRKHKLNQAYIEENIFMLNKKQTAENLELATRNAYEKVNISKDQIATAIEVMTLSEKGFSIAKMSYEVGDKTYLDMQNAELEVEKAKQMYYAALFEFHSALVDLKLLLGDL